MLSEPRGGPGNSELVEFVGLVVDTKFWVLRQDVFGKNVRFTKGTCLRVLLLQLATGTYSLSLVCANLRNGISDCESYKKRTFLPFSVSS